MGIKNWYNKDIIVFPVVILLALLITTLDRQLHFGTILIQSVHAVVATITLVLCIVTQIRHPEVRHFGWNKIVWGVAAITFGTYIDILDDTPTFALFQITDEICGRCLVQNFLKKIIGYTAGLGLLALGFSQWVPWMLENQEKVKQLNLKLSQANREINGVLMSLDDHIESERLVISRELHDNVAQQLIFLGMQLQMCRREISKDPQKVEAQLETIFGELAETHKSLRQVSRDLRPESLYTLGLVGALEQFIDKLRQQDPGIRINLHDQLQPEAFQRIRLESRLNDRDLLHLYRVLQEGIRNAIKHSKANQIDVYIEESSGQFRFKIEDDGQGLPWTEIPAEDELVHHGHLGIIGVRERVKEFSGSFILANRPSSGTCMEILLEKPNEK
jgi:signal transduction histidine kinase